MLKLSHLFLLFLLSNVTNLLYSMNDRLDLWNDHSDAVQHYRDTKNLTKHKIERQKKHQGLSSKKKHLKLARIHDTKATK